MFLYIRWDNWIKNGNSSSERLLFITLIIGHATRILTINRTREGTLRCSLRHLLTFFKCTYNVFVVSNPRHTYYNCERHYSSSIVDEMDWRTIFCKPLTIGISTHELLNDSYYTHILGTCLKPSETDSTVHDAKFSAKIKSFNHKYNTTQA